tara:strand:- start:104 stop:901 length:798 start_codon:yes stop_codon:yes gene_type:complete
MKITSLQSKNILPQVAVLLIALNPFSIYADVFVAGLNALDRNHYASAYRSFKPLADNGIAEAQNNLGFLYQNGLGVRRNYNTAIKWYQLAANQGLSEAEHNIGMLNYWGYGVSQDFNIARRWFSKSAEKGLGDSHYMIGLIFFKGEGTQVSTARASKHFTDAAKSGNANAQYMLAHMIVSGDTESGYKQSSERLSPFDFEIFSNKASNQLIAALALASLASKNGQDSANQLVEFLKFQVDEEQISIAETLSQDCIATNYKNCPVF